MSRSGRTGGSGNADPTFEAVLKRTERTDEREAHDGHRSTATGSVKTEYRRASVPPDMSAMFARILAADARKHGRAG